MALRGALAALALTSVLALALAGCGSPAAAPSPSGTLAGGGSPGMTSPPPAEPSTPPWPAGDACHVAGVTYCELNPAVSQETIRITICVVGWTAEVRPPSSYTTPLKVRQMQQQGLKGAPQDFEEDHRMPLELGGATREESNLSPQPHPASSNKDVWESTLHDNVCAGRMTLADAQMQMRERWLGAYPGYRQ